MESTVAIEALSALAHPGRLDTFRLLVRAGPDGLPAGDAARALNAPAATMSAQLAILARAGLIAARRDGRSIIYAADFAAVGGLIDFLMEDCCQGQARTCAPARACAPEPEIA